MRSIISRALNPNLTDHPATRLFGPNVNVRPHIFKSKKKEKDKVTPREREGPGPLGSTGFGEIPGQHYVPGGSGELEAPSSAPSPGGGTFVGPGGQAPPFAPGGPENPYPPSAGMPPPNVTLPPGSAANQPGFTGSGAIGSGIPPGQPGFMGTPVTQGMEGGNYPASSTMPSSIMPSSVGGMGTGMYPSASTSGTYQYNPQLPGHGITPGQFQPGGGPALPSSPNLPTSASPYSPTPYSPTQQSHTSSSYPVPNPANIPGQTGGPRMSPQQQQSQAQAGIKPRGVRTLPMPEKHQPPEGPPKPPGQWITVDAGKGQPPAFGFLPQQHADPSGSMDTGLEGSPKKHQQQPGQKPPEKSDSDQKGHYVPLQLREQGPREQDGDDEAEPIWCWIPEISSDYGVKKKEPKEHSSSEQKKP